MEQDEEICVNSIDMGVDVEKIGAVEAVEKYGGVTDVLLMSWPPYNEPTAYECMQAWGREKPIIFIGEGSQGCTADNQFFNGFDEVDMIDIPTFVGIHDYAQKGYWNGK